jgi:hypothetical protein
MRTNWMRNMLLAAVMAATLFYTSCGTLLYPERRGQCSGRIDAGVAVMDGIGLIFFLIPGIIAFAVDFSTGAIYLPEDTMTVQNGAADMSGMVVVRVDKTELTPSNIERLVGESTGKTIDLSRPDVVATRVDGETTE